MNDKMILARSCLHCHTEIKLFALPEGTMTDPAPAKTRLFVVKRCPNCGKKVFFWVGWKQVLK